MANTKKYVSLDKLSLYDEKIKKVISDGDAAALASAEAKAKAYADSLATNYDEAGAAATAESNANTYTDGKIGEVNGVVAGVKTIAEQGVSDAAKAQAAADKAQGEVDALAAYVGTIPEGATATNVVAYVQEKTSGIATEGAMTELGNRVGAVEGKVATIEGDYLKGSDKTALEGKINLKADQTSLDSVSAVANAAVKQSDYDTKVAALEAEDERIAGLVATEAERAAGVEAGLKGRIETMEAFWSAAQADGTDSNVIDTLKEIQEYIASDETGAANMLAAIESNEKAIEDMDAAYQAADTAIKGRLDVLEAINHEAYVAADTALKNELSAEIAKKAVATEVAASIEALQGVDTGLGNRIAALEAKHGDGEGTVESMIAAAKASAEATAAADATSKANKALEDAKKYADDEDAKIESRVDALEVASATHALASDLTALTGRVTTAEGEIDTLQTEMDAVEALAAANKAAHEANAAAIALKASQADLNAVSGRVTTLETWHSNFVECSQEDINGLFA